MTTQPARRGRRHSAILAFVILAALALAALGPPVAMGVGWEIQLQGEDTWINQVKAISATEAWVIRDDPPKLMHTTDGANWFDANTTGLGDDYEAMGFFDSLVGCVGNRLGMVAYTTDGGSTWGQVQTTCQAQEISYATAGVAWMGGMGPRGKILYTNDGGATWTEQIYDATLQKSLNAVSAPNSTTCWASTSDGVLRSTDTGATWPATNMTVPAGGYVSCLYATDANHAWAGGGATGSRFIMATADGGATWTTQYSGPSGSDFNAIDVLPDNLHGWAVSGDGVVFFTIDGGATWQAQVSGVDTILLDVDFVDATNGWASGTSGTIIHTGDGGGPADTTPPVTTPNMVSGTWVNAANANLYLASTDAGVGPWRIYYKVDSAADWSWGWGSGFTASLTGAADGAHQIQYYGVDTARNEETVQDFTLNVDTKAPVAAGLKKAAVKRNKTVALKYRINDALPNGGHGSAMIKIKNKKGKVVKTLFAGNKPVNKALSYRYKCKLPKGVYKYVVSVVDQVGNSGPQIRSAKLTVK